MNIQQKQDGMSLIELMIATLIGILMMTAAIGLLISNKRVYKEHNEMGRLQENARFGMQLLINDIRRAGFTGCADDIANVTNDITNTVTALRSYTATTFIEGSESLGGWTPSGSAEPFGDVAGTDAITVRTIQPIQVGVSLATTASLVPAASTSDIAINDPVAVFDCGSATIFDATGITGGLQGVGISSTYGTDAEIAKFSAVRYYIAATNDADGDGVNDPALWRTVWDDVTDGLVNEELIEGVDNMQILYGVDNTADGIPNSYQNATGVAANGGWSNVITVRLSLLFRTIKENFSLDPDSKTFTMLGTNIAAAGDRRRRKVVNTTIQIRNSTTL